MKCNCEGRIYELTATNYILCIECGSQYPNTEGNKNEV